MSDIQWPAGFVPGFTDNFCSNEVIVTGISVDAAWPRLCGRCASALDESNCSPLSYWCCSPESEAR